MPYGIQKDLLCAQSPHYRQFFAQQGEVNKVEHIVRLPDTDIEVFGCFQNFIYTGDVYDKQGGREVPSYPILMGVWKLAAELRMAPLRASILDVMAERRQQTGSIPGTSLMKQAWKETTEGSGLRKMLTGWAAEHMRASPDARNDFAKALPQEILSELVIVMSDLPAADAPANAPRSPNTTRFAHIPPNGGSSSYQSPYAAQVPKRPRKSENGAMILNGDEAYDVKPAIKKARKSEPIPRKPKPRMTNNSVAIYTDPDRDLAYCRDLISRMLSGPGFWTRLVGPFKDPVDPISHNAPNYFDVVKRPMCLKQIKFKMDQNEYSTSGEFEADVRLIFQNCYEYWTPDDPVFRDCEALEKYFNEKWGKRDKWVPPNVKMEIID
ncbi:Bromodomain-containing protein [Amylocarpus encephaloides]|uniref:Bromodomain-containing protein n=1 Tax=Amylocarpus encephaloides TaxID=45428 RepID=A0A9P7YM22_9HELO|nr:Bromodomain-containing protein [Amylocarpus encephaloides]